MGWRRALFGRTHAEQVLDDEVRHHLDLLTEEYEKGGLAPDEARRAAALRFGAVSAMKEGVREQTGIARAEGLWQDLRFTIRTFAAQPGFVAVLLVTLALGVGANTAVYSVLRAVLLKPLPLPEPDRIMFVWEQDRVNHTTREGASFPDYVDLEAGATRFSELAALQPMTATLTGEGEPERVDAARVTSNYFAVLGVQAELGRTFRPGEPGLVLSHAFWQRKFSGSPDVVGRALKLDGFSGTVLGIMPAGADALGTQARDLWTAMDAVRNKPGRGQHDIAVMGRLRNDATVEQAQAEVSAIMTRLEHQYPDDNRGRGAAVVPLHEDLAGALRPALQVLAGAVAVLLVIGCLNIANLLLARGSTRAREMAIRVSLGAGRGRLLRQLLTESLVLALCGAGLGVLVALAGVRALVWLAPPDVPLIGRTTVDWNATLVAVAISIAAWIVFGVVPAVRASAIAPSDALKESAHATVTKGPLRLRHGVLMAQLAMTCVLVITAGLLARSFWRLQQADLGYRPHGLVTLRLQLPETRYSTPHFPEFRWPQGLAFLDRLKQAAAALPGVDVASIAMAGPNRRMWTSRVAVVGRPIPTDENQEEAQVRSADPDYLKAIGAPLVAGRFFDATDTAQHRPVMVVNAAFARHYFPGEAPVGRSIDVLFGPREIVGVIGDIRYGGPADPPSPTMYFPAAQFALPEQTLIVRTSGDAARLIPTLRRVVHDLDPEIAPFDVQTVDAALETTSARQRFTLALLTTFAVLALTLAIVGIYGIAAYSVGRRKKEIALRMALGGSAIAVCGRVLGGVLLCACVGIAAGMAGALATGRLLRPLVFETSTRDVTTFAIVPLVLLTAVFLGTVLPARRIAAVNAASTLREE